MRFVEHRHLRKSSMFWKVRAMPRLAMRSGRIPGSSRPSNRTVPFWAWYTAGDAVQDEVLPAPLGPMMANSSLVWTWNETPSTALTPAKDRWMSVHLEDDLPGLAAGGEGTR